MQLVRTRVSWVDKTTIKSDSKVFDSPSSVHQISSRWLIGPSERRPGLCRLLARAQETNDVYFGQHSGYVTNNENGKLTFFGLREAE